MNDLSHEAHELVLFAENEHTLANQYTSIVNNLRRRIAKGTYDPEKAPLLWKYWFDAAAREYTRQFGTPSARHGAYGCFSPAMRREAAQWYAKAEYATLEHN